MRRFELCYAAAAGAVAIARAEVADHAARAGVPEAQLDDVRLAVSEAVTNAIQHGYRGGPGEIWVCTEVGARELVIVVRDRGVGIDAPPAVDRIGLGCGLRIIGGVADAMDVRRHPDGGTELRMRFALRAPGFPLDAPELALALVA